MKSFLLLGCFSVFISISSRAQDLVGAASKFINLLDSSQKALALYPFNIDERYNFHFFPKENRKGISINQLNAMQQQAAFNLLKSSLSEEAVKKTKGIIELESVLKSLEHRKTDDHYRDPGKYYVTVFGIPGNHTIWGWRFEGHHISFTFSADANKLVSGSPGFLGANPAVVPEGPQKGVEVLKEETEMGFALLHSFSGEQLKKAIIDTDAPGEIITFVSRKAMIEKPAGILYVEMTDQQKEKFLQLIRLYVYRYTKLFADEMLKEIQQAGLNELRFAWAGQTEAGIGHPHYYRIQGPTIIIEYDNTQNRANHIHTVVRDLRNDFGGDLLLQHYQDSH